MAPWVNARGDRTSSAESPLIVASDAMRKVTSMLNRIAASPAAVLILGETGTGKELIARELHEQSPRRGKPMIDINCGALPEHLVESELFGYEKGAFSGADQTKKGLFELANGGTVFLDEVGELVPTLQVKLLRVLDSAPYYRLGGNTKVQVDVRVIAATNQPLERLVEAGDFRRDLYHRLRQFQLNLPPLRERKEDIVALAHHFLSELDPSRVLTASAINALCDYSWPGNIRELKSVLLQAVTLRDEVNLTADSFMFTNRSVGDQILVQVPAPIPKTAETVAAESKDLTSLEKKAIIEALGQVQGHQGLAAARLGISRRTLSRKLKQYQIERTGNSLGSMSPEQQLRFRYALDIPVQVTTSNGDQMTVRSMNISIGGISVKDARELSSQHSGMSLSFELPGCEIPIQSGGKLAWAESDGTVGICFTNAPRQAQLALGRWLRERQTSEGWDA